MLSSLDAVHVSAVLEDCVDQLAILGHIMPPSLEGRSDAAQIVDDELGQILQDQRFLESRYEVVRVKANGAVNCILRNSSFDIRLPVEWPRCRWPNFFKYCQRVQEAVLSHWMYM